MTQYTTTAGATWARLSPDLLLVMFDAGVALGLGTDSEAAASPEIEQLITHIRMRWFAEVDASRNWRRQHAPLPQGGD